jgi:hypothetical protein
LLLFERRVDAIAVPDLHSTTACHGAMTISGDYRRGSHVVSALHVIWLSQRP